MHETLSIEHEGEAFDMEDLIDPWWTRPLLRR